MTETYTSNDGTATDQPSFLDRADGHRIAYHRTAGEPPGVIFLGGFKSDMTGTKATWLERHCGTSGRAFLRFDYLGHGQSSGEFIAGTIGRWAEDAIYALDHLTEGPQILVGSSMGGWIMLLTALARPARVAGLIGIAAAPDFTEDLMWRRYDDTVREALLRDGVHFEPSEYDTEQPYPITMTLIEDGRAHLLLRKPIALHCPVWLLHGMKDTAVPWMTASRLAEKLLSEHVRILLIKDGDHRLSRDQDLSRLSQTLDEMIETVSAGGNV